MPPFVVIDPSEVIAKAPVDDLLMGRIKQDLDYLLSAIGASNVQIFDFRVNGDLGVLSGKGKRLDTAVIAKTQTLVRQKLFLDRPGTGGSLVVDIRKFKPTNTPLTMIEPLYSDSIQSVARAGGGLNTQAVNRSTPQIATQSIAYYKAALNVQSILAFYGNDGAIYRTVNLDAAPDADYVRGDSVTLSGTALNDGLYTIVDINRDGGNNLVIAGNGTDETTPAGTAQLMAFAYVFSNPISTEFTAGELADFATHTAGANDGQFTVFAINQSGNNIIVKNPIGVTQGGVAGHANVLRFEYALTAPASTSDYIVGEKAHMVGHNNAANDGDFPIVHVNFTADNVVVYNPAGVVDATAAGTVNTNRWVFSLPTDPAGEFSVGHRFKTTGTTGGSDDSVDPGFTVVEIDRSAGTNLVTYSTSVVAQGGVAGTLQSTRLKYEFASDQSAVYSTASRIETDAGEDDSFSPGSGGVMLYLQNAGDFDVLEVNHGGGANYNVVVENYLGVAQLGAGGRIATESKSIFATRPRIDFDSLIPAITEQGYCTMVSNGVYNGEASLSDGDILGFNIDQVPTGFPATVAMQIG